MNRHYSFKVFASRETKYYTVSKHACDQSTSSTVGGRTARVVDSECHPSLCRARIELWLGYLHISGDASPITMSLDQNEKIWVTSPASAPSVVSVESISLLKYHRMV